jgi:hypothetical protein
MVAVVALVVIILFGLVLSLSPQINWRRASSSAWGGCRS